MVASIPASRFVKITPGALSAGGSALDLSGLVLTKSTRVPIGAVKAFTSAAAVGAFFGLASPEYLGAIKYFKGFTGRTASPGNILFSQFAAAPVNAYLAGASVAAVPLATLKALSGTLSLTIDGVAVTSAEIDLSTATSLSGIAALITVGLGVHDVTATASTTTASTLLTVTGVTTGTITVGQSVSGAGIPAGTTITALGTGTGGAGTYTMSAAATATNAATPILGGQAVASYDSTWNAFVITGGTPGAQSTITVANDGELATGLALTAATGATTSQGSDAMTPAAAMTAVLGQTQNFASFATTWNDVGDNVAFAAWNDNESNRYVFAQWDTSQALTTSAYEATAWGLIQAAGYAAVLPLFDPIDGFGLACAVMGIFASIDFTAANGRTNLAYRSQSGLTPGVSSDDVFGQLEANGVTFYALVGTANDQFEYFWEGAVSGPFLWADTLVNEIWMTNAFQLRLIKLLTVVKSIPYNDAGNELISLSLADDIAAAISFGAIRTGVSLSADQAEELELATGLSDAATTLETVGWLLVIGTALAAVRVARGSPPISFYYTDGGSVQRIDLNSTGVL